MWLDVGAAELVDRQRAAVAELDTGRVEAEIHRCSGACRCTAARASSRARGRPRASAGRRRDPRCRSPPARPFLITSMPRLRNTSSSTSARSGSSLGSSWSRAETSVTREPQREKKSANSQPVGPAPSTTRCSGRSRSSNTCAGRQHPAGVRARERRHERRRAGADQQGVELRPRGRWPSTVVDQRVRAGDTAAAGQHPHVHAVHPLAHAAALVQRDGPRPGQRAAQVDLREALREVDPVVLGPAGSRASRRPSSAASSTGSRRSSCSCRRAGCSSTSVTSAPRWAAVAAAA